MISTGFLLQQLQFFQRSSVLALGVSLTSLALVGSASDIELYSGLSVTGHAEPVPVHDMINGWDGPFQSGRYALGDVRLVAGVQWQHWFLERESRWHYDLRFSRGMSRYYAAQEQNRPLASSESLMLDVKSIEAWGARLGRRFEWSSDWGEWQLSPALALYRAGHFQFGHLSGVAEAGGTERASARLQYFYDEDKILEHDPQVPKGWGASVDVHTRWHAGAWQAELQIQDVLNRWQWDEAAFTTACINFNDPQQSVCSSSGTASGRSGQTRLIERLTPTTRARVAHSQWQTEAGLEWHGDYRRLGLYQFFGNGRLGVSAHTTRQLGVHWRSDWLTFQWLSDDLRLTHARDLDVQMGIRVGW